MSIWLDMLGTEIRFVQTPSFGRVRIAEGGDPSRPTIIFLHGIGGHLEAYSRTLVPLSLDFHVVAFDYVGHGLSEKRSLDYTPLVLMEQLGELMTVLRLKRANLSGESLGGWVAGFFAGHHPDRVERLMLNTTGGIPILTEKGRRDLEDLKALSRKAAEEGVNARSVRDRMKWLFHPKNDYMIDDELVNLRLRFYTEPGAREVAPLINRMMGLAVLDPKWLIPLESIRAQTLFLWTRDNPIHDLEAARSACARVPDAQFYVMEHDSCHWPQYEAPNEFNTVAKNFFTDGRIA